MTDETENEFAGWSDAELLDEYYDTLDWIRDVDSIWWTDAYNEDATDDAKERMPSMRAEIDRRGLGEQK